MQARRILLSGWAVLTLLVGIGLCAPAHAQLVAQIELVGYSTSTLSSTGATSYSITVPAGVQVGDLMLSVNSNVPGTGGGGPSSWTYLQNNITSPASIGLSIWYRVATSADVAGSTAYTWTVTSSSVVGGAITAFRGVDNTNPVVGFSYPSSPCTYTTGVGCATIATSSNNLSRTAPSLTPGVSGTTLVALYGAANGSSDTPSVPIGTTKIFAAGTGATNGLYLSAFYESLAAATASGNFVSTSSSISTTSVGGTVSLQPATLSPTAYWHLDQTSWSGTSGEVIDSGGSGYNGVAESGATTADTNPAISGTPGTCYYGSFNGSSQFVELPNAMPHPGTTFSVTAWIYPTSTSIGRIFSDDQAGNGWAVSYGDPGTGLIRFFARQPSLAEANSTVALSLNTWYFVVAIMDALSAKTMTLLIYNTSGTLVQSVSGAVTGFSAGTGTNQGIGDTIGGGNFFPGYIDEVIVYPGALTTAQAASLVLARHTCAVMVPNHYDVVNAGTAVNCAPTPVTIYAHSSTHTVVTTVDGIVLGTSTGHGDWTLTTGNGTFVAGASNSGAATYTYTAADAGTAVFALRDTYAETVTINVTDGSVTATSGTATAAEDAALIFKASGFIITNGSNVATTIVTQVAGVTSTQSLALQAVRTDTKTGACTAVFASGTTVSIGLAYQCNNAATCVSGQTFKLTNNGTTTALASNPNSAVTNYTTVPLKFSTANAEAPFTLNYSDAGQISLEAKYTIPLGSGSGSGNTMLGAAQFVVQPYTLQLSNIMRTSNSFANPAASTASGTVFLPAGQPFTATVTAYSSPGTAVTPNFGQETSPPTVTLTPALVLPTSGDVSAISGSFGTYTTGAASGTAFSWPEVGIITLTPGVTNYIATGNTVTGTTTGNVGRFIPNNFAVATNTPLFATACTAGKFTYLGQPFTYSSAPVITVTAQSLGGTTTLNYTGSLFRLTNASVTSRTYTPTPSSPTLITTGLPATTSDPTIASSGSGVGTLTFSAGTGLSFTRGTPIAPLSANIALSINVIDLDAVAATTNPVTFGASTGIQFTTTGNTQYYGRLALTDALGSELLDLPMPLTTQYYLSTTAGFTTNTADTCTAAPAIAFSNYLVKLQAGETCVRDTGNPGVSGAGCSTAGPTAREFDATAVAGGFNLYLAAPGSGNNGAMTVTATAPAWLQYLWSASSGINSNPTGNATFGLFPGPASRIYQREVY